MTLSTRFWADHQHLLALAFPMILANITTPLLGMVDTAVLGHMETSSILAGSAIGALILTQTYWVCGFLRMSTTGLSAQAKGQNDSSGVACASVFYRSTLLALVIGAFIVICGPFLLQGGLYLASASGELERHAQSYFFVRVWGAPAAMLNMALIGYLVGQQRTKAVLMIQVIGNLLNAGLDVLFVYGLDLSVEGVALASVIAEYTMATLGALLCLRSVLSVPFSKQWFTKAQIVSLLTMNTDMLVRNLALQVCIAFLTFQGARLGAEHAAVNAILMQFFVLIALGLDGVAYAVEALVGEAKGAKNNAGITHQTKVGLIWSSLFAAAYAVVFYTSGEAIIRLLTDIPSLQNEATRYLWLIVLLPLIGHWCFLFDGIFVGLTQSRAMRDTMLLSAAGVFFPIWWLTQSIGNLALWYAMAGFLAARGLSLGFLFWRQYVKLAR